MRRDRVPYLVIPIAALIAVLPLIFHGPSCGHDFDFHILNWFEAAAQFRHGNLHPQWAFSPAWNAGEPRFVFYPPLSWSLGAVLGLILPWAYTPIAYTWVALTLSGFAMHRLARAHAGPTAALIASTLYLANPYMLFTAYERTAYAELLGAAWLPLLLQAVLKPRPAIPAIAIPLALLWLTNAPAAVMGTYTLALLVILRLIHKYFEKRTKFPSFRKAPSAGDTGDPAFRLALTTLTGTLLGLALAVFYILPAAREQPLVQIAMVVIPGMRIDDNTLFHHTGVTEDALAHDAVLHTASLIAVVILSLTALALLSVFFRQSRRPPGSISPVATPTISRQTLFPVAVVTLTVATLLTPVALPIWHHAPELAFLQFPWRLLAILAAVLGLATALALSPFRWKTTCCALAALLIAATLTAASTPIFRQSCDPEDTVPARLVAFQSHAGFEPTDEYTPTSADNDALQHDDPPFWLSPDPDAPPPANGTPGTAPANLTVDSHTAQYLILNLRRYPDWHVRLNGSELSPGVLAQRPRTDGLFNLLLPAGTSHINLAYRTGHLEYVADAVSVLALLTLIWIAVMGRPKSHPKHILSHRETPML